MFKPLIYDFAIVYLHDILTFSKSWEDHVKQVKKVLDVLKKEKMYFKCQNVSMKNIFTLFGLYSRGR